MLSDGSDFPIFPKYWPKKTDHFGKHYFPKYPLMNGKYSRVNIKIQKFCLQTDIHLFIYFQIATSFSVQRWKNIFFEN